MLIEIYSKDNCPSCLSVKKMLNDHNLLFNEYKIGIDISREDVLKRFPHATTVPVMVVDGAHVLDPDAFQFLTEQFLAKFTANSNSRPYSEFLNS